MYRKKIAKVSLFLALLSTAGCGDSITFFPEKGEDSVTFSPEQGDERRYWVYSLAKINTDSGNEAELYTESLLSYLVEQIDKQVKLHVAADHIEYVSLYSGFSSLKPRAKMQYMQPLFSKGFDLSYNANTGELLALEAIDTELWKQLLEYEGLLLINELKTSMAAPGLISSIPTSVGSKISINTFNNVPTTLVVDRVTDNSLYVTLTSEINHAMPKHNLAFAKIKLERESGWIEDLLMFTRVPFEIKGKKYDHQLLLAMRPENKPSNLFRRHRGQSVYNDDEDELLWSENKLYIDLSTTDTQYTEDEVMSYSSGFYEHDYEGILLKLPTKSSKQRKFGTVRFEDFKAFDANNQPIELQFSSSSQNDYFVGEHSEYIEQGAGTIIRPIGWNKAKEISQIKSITATAHYYPSQFETHKVKWKGGKEQIYKLGNMTVTIHQSDKTENEYRVEYKNSANSWLLESIDGIHGEIAYPSSQQRTPNWVSHTGKMMFELLGEPEIVERSFLLRLSETPDEITFVVVNEREKLSFSKPVRFIDQESYLADPNMPPRVVSPNKFVSESVEVAAKRDIRNFDLEKNILVATDSFQTSVIAMPKEWAAVCDHNIIDSPQVAGKPLTWQTVHAADVKFARPEQKSNVELTYLQLMTPDKIRRSFYGFDVNTQITCKGEPVWREFPYQPSQKPWLVDITQWKNVDSQQTVRHFIERTRFYDDSGQPLYPIDQNGFKRKHGGQDKLSSILFDERFIKLSGYVATVERLEHRGEAIERQLVSHFPPLPKG